MAHLGIDVEASSRLSSRLRRLAAGVDEVRSTAVEASTLAGLAVPAVVVLGDIEQMLDEVASAVIRAAEQAAKFRIDGLERRYDLTDQQASHNSYAVDGGIDALHAHGLRAFEVDIHRGPPTDFWRGPLSPLGIVQRYLDHRSHAGGHDDDWLVYHHSGDTQSQYETLRHALRTVAALDGREVLTVFVDNKDAFGGPHTPERFDALLDDELGDRLFGPVELARLGGEWPTMAQLRGRVIVVITDESDGYPRHSGRAFVALEPSFADGVGGLPRHLPAPGVVFYNAAERDLDAAEITAIREAGFVVRTHGGERCAPPPGRQPTFRAVDHVAAEPPCEPRPT